MLIMSLVVVPLVNNFAVVAKTNVKAREIKAATDFAQQIMESLQAYGADSVNDQFWQGQTYSHSVAGGTGTSNEHDGTTPCMDPYPCPHDSSYKASDHLVPFSIVDIDKDSVSDDLTLYYKVYADAAFQGYADKLYSQKEKRYYAVYSAKADGGGVYDVRITYDPTRYEEKKDGAGNVLNSVRAFNENDFPDISTLDADTTAVINPNGPFVNPVIDEEALGRGDDDIFKKAEDGIGYAFTRGDTEGGNTSGRSYEEIVSEAYYELYEGYYQELAAKVQEYLYENWLSDSVVISASSLRSANPSKTEKLADIQKETARTTQMVITENEGTGEASLHVTVDYELTDANQIGNLTDAKDKIDDIVDAIAKNTDVTGFDKNGVASALKEIADNIDKKFNTQDNLNRSMEVYYDDSEMDLKSIYYMYTPLLSGWKSDSLVLKSEHSGEADSDRAIDLYLVPQRSIMDADYPASVSSNWSELAINYKTLELNETNSIDGLKPENLAVKYVTGFADVIQTANPDDTTIISKFGKTQNVLYDITVQVFKHGDPGGECLAELTLAGI